MQTTGNFLKNICKMYRWRVLVAGWQNLIRVRHFENIETIKGKALFPILPVYFLLWPCLGDEEIQVMRKKVENFCMILKFLTFHALFSLRKWWWIRKLLILSKHYSKAQKYMWSFHTLFMWWHIRRTWISYAARVVICSSRPQTYLPNSKE